MGTHTKIRFSLLMEGAFMGRRLRKRDKIDPV